MLEPSQFLHERLAARHDRSAFACGEEALDRYLKVQASQDLRKNAAAVFVVVHVPTGKLAGYFTLSQTSLELAEIPEDMRRELPRYPKAPATLLGRLAVDKAFQGAGLGAWIMGAAFDRCLAAAEHAGSVGVVVDALHAGAAAFYRRFGFRPLLSSNLKMILRMREIQEARDSA